ncbi:MAG: flagellar biosynthetic protein FliO [Clostridiales bacterium]|jgi:flagellar biogenesis protein FliO|nr:flagellar biosynthetic protein FliO [Clostridiales bacterium]
MLLAASGNGGEVSNFAGQALSMLVILAVLIFGGIWLVKVISRVKITGAFGGNICVIEGVGIGIGCSLHIIRAGNKYFLIGAGKESISLLAEIPREEIKEPKTMSSAVFQQYLDKFLKKKGNGDE